MTYSLQVNEINKETDDTITVKFKQPVFKKIKYLPGQYVSLIFKINNRRYIRPYSISSSPETDSTLNIAIKRIPGGVVSNYMFNNVNIGDIIETFAPTGTFILPLENELLNKDVVCWGCGSGITPLFSIIKHVTATKPNNRILLIYGNRCSDSVIYKKEIEDLQKKYTDRFLVTHFFSNPATDEASLAITGRIDPDKFLSEHDIDNVLKNQVHYICGPNEMKNAVATALKKAGVGDQSIFIEDFHVVRNPEDFKDIDDQIVALIKDNETVKVKVLKGKSILEAGLDAFIDLDYSCQTGDCQLCKATVLNGNLKTLGTVNAKGLLTNDILLCCSFPGSDNIEIKLN